MLQRRTWLRGSAQLWPLQAVTPKQGQNLVKQRPTRRLTRSSHLIREEHVRATPAAGCLSLAWPAAEAG